jgi:predicted Zn-dependent peptidase
MYGLKSDFHKNYTSGIMNVTLKDVVQAAHENIKCDSIVTVIVGNMKNIGTELEKFAQSEGCNVTSKVV